MKTECQKCGGEQSYCDACNSPVLLCACFEAQTLVDCTDCTPLVKGGQGRSANDLNAACDNLIALMILGVLVIVAAILIASTK